MLLKIGSLEFYRTTFLYCLIIMLTLEGSFKFENMWLKFEVLWRRWNSGGHLKIFKDSLALFWQRN